MLTGCREHRERLIELAREAVSADEHRMLLAHVESCADCARALDEQLALSAALGRLTVEELPEADEIEVGVLAEFDRVAARRAPRWALVAGLAAAALLGVVFIARRQPVPPAPQRGETAALQAAPMLAPGHPAPAMKRVKHVRHEVTGRQSGEASQPFVTIPYTVPLSPEERTAVVRMEIPVAALIAAGFNVPVSDAGALVEADVLVSQDGRARAIRPLAVLAFR
jgi:hypothetical protein